MGTSPVSCEGAMSIWCERVSTCNKLVRIVHC
jgi:hypothetical protein